MSEVVSFADEIEANRIAVEVPSQVVSAETLESSLGVRLRGAFITNCELTSPTTGLRTDVLYAEPDIKRPKITATHSMVPAGPSKGIGGQHGFPRWADYHQFPLEDGPYGEKRFTVQAKRSDTGISLVKSFELAYDALTTRTTIANSEDTSEQTSIGEHLYFSLADENLEGIKINGKTLDQLLGQGSQHTVENDGTLSWNFGGGAIIKFPAGHSVKLSAGFKGSSRYPLAMWIWKRPDSPSICFEPVIGVDASGENRAGIRLPAYGSATLSTRIELL